jgi:hypothetical protein
MLVEKYEVLKAPERSICKYEDNIKMGLKLDISVWTGFM